MDRQGFPVETLSKKACNISATGMNLELFGKILELEWIWNWTKFDFRLGEWNWTSSNFDLEDRNGSRSKKYGPVTMYDLNCNSNQWMGQKTSVSARFSNELYTGLQASWNGIMCYVIQHKQSPGKKN